MRRDTESNFLDNLEVSKRGIVKTAASQLPNGKEIVTYSNVMQDIEKVLRAFDKSPEITHATIDIYKKRASLGDNPKSVAQDFFKELVAQRAKQAQMSLATAMAYRQVGIFKVASRDVYEDLETGDFWKISKDKKHVMRLFKEDDKGVADKKASVEEIKHASSDKKVNDACNKAKTNLEFIMNNADVSEHMPLFHEMFDVLDEIEESDVDKKAAKELEIEAVANLLF